MQTNGKWNSFFFAVSRPTPAEALPGNSHQSSSDPGLVRVRPTLGHRFAYDTVRSEQHGGFKLPFSWDEGDGTGEPRLLAGSSEASTQIRPQMFCTFHLHLN